MTSEMTEYALNAITLVPRERVCDYNRNPANTNRKIIDVDIYVAGQQRGTWRRKSDDDKYSLYLEVLDFRGAVTWSQNVGISSTKIDALKAVTADLLVAGELPTRREYREKLAMVYIVDYWKVVASVLFVIGLSWYLLRSV